MKKIPKKGEIKKFKLIWLENTGSEIQEAHNFWIELLFCLGEEYPTQFIDFEKNVKTGRIDGYIRQTHTLIEHKSKNIDLDSKEMQSDGTYLTPFEQALRYANDLIYREKPRWIVITNFDEIRIHDMDSDNPSNNYDVVLLQDIDK